MARVKLAGTTGASENTIVFLPAGGHSHNGRNSSLIDSTAYSMYDFSPTFVGTEINPERAVRQENNRIALEDTIKRVVNNSVLAPAGIRLEAGSLNGSLIIANTITANNLAANTITADEIAANTITANELSSNIVLINNRITSQNWDGTVLANGTILANGIGTAGWAITNTHAVFDSTLIRGSIAANSLLTPNLAISNTGAITSTNFNVTAGGNVTATNANITGTITSTSGTIGGWTIQSTRLFAGSTYLYSNGYISASSGNFSGTVNASGGTFSGSITATGTISGGTISGATIAGSIISGGRFNAGASTYLGDMTHLNGYYHGLDLGGSFTNCFIRGDGGEIYFRVNNGSQWIKFENGSVQINAAGFSIDGTSATFSGSLSGASGSVTNNFSVGTGCIIGGSLTIGNNVRVNGASGDGAVSVLKIRADDQPNDNTTNSGREPLKVVSYLNNTAFRVLYDGRCRYGLNMQLDSDIRLKKNIQTTTLGLDFIKKLNPVSYQWDKDGLGEPDRRHHGFISQEVRAVSSQFEEKFEGSSLDDIEDPDSIQSLDYVQFIAPLVKAVQELSERIEYLESKGV